MKLIVDVGNTRITFALFDEGKLIRQKSVEEKEKYSTDYFVMFISGEYAQEQKWEALRAQYPDKIGIYIGYNDALAHLVYGSSDFFLMPSLFEPCGLGQMIAQRYGTLPIVRRTGGLRDSVINFDSSNEETSNCFNAIRIY